MSNKLVCAVLLTVAALSLGCFLRNWLGFDPNAPRFVAAKARFIPGPQERVAYEFLNSSPFEGGKMWVSAGSKKENHVYLYDIDNRKILGELLNARPVYFNRDQSKLLCSRRSPAGRVPRIKRRILEILADLGWLKNALLSGGDDQESFWVLDLKRNATVRIGVAYQLKGAGSIFRPSPTFQYGFNKTSGSSSRPEILISDIESLQFRREPVDGFPFGWWDDEQVLLKDSNNDFVLYNVVARKAKPFLSFPQLRSFYTDSDFTNDPARATPFIMWNGRTNDFYLTDGNKRWGAEDSFLAKIERPDGALKLLAPHFKFEWSDHLDATGNFYLYSGRLPGKTNSAVYLRDWKRGKTRELVPPDPTTQSFSIPRFYGGEVIYFRSNALWQIKVDGGNNRRLFPPPEAPP